MTNQKLIDLLLSLTHLPKETEWVEFKGDNAEPDEIGEYLSALANSAALHQKDAAYLVWGVEDVRIKLLEPASSQGIQKLGTRSSRTGLRAFCRLASISKSMNSSMRATE